MAEVSILRKRPAELGTPAVSAVVFSLLSAFGVDAEKAGAIAGAVAVFAPAVITLLVARSQPLAEKAREVALKVEEVADIIDAADEPAE